MAEEATKKRGKAIKQFIKIAKACHDMNNFNTTFAIVYALNRPGLARLNQAWEVGFGGVWGSLRCFFFWQWWVLTLEVIFFGLVQF